MSHQKYWLARHNSKLDDVKRVFKLAEMLVARAPPPWKPARRGRRPKFSPRRHAAICITMACLNLTYREVEGQAPLFMGMTIDHSTVGWALKRLRKEYLELLISLLRRKLEKEVSPDFFVPDSTGISTPRFRIKKRAFKRVKTRACLKFHALLGCSLKDSAVVVYSASVTGGHVHDSSQFKLLISDSWARSKPLLGDPAYDWEFIREHAKLHGFKPVIKPRKHGEDPHGFARREAFKEFEDNFEIYKLRNVAEGFFGGIKNRYGSRTRCKLPSTEISNIILMAIAHNIRTLARIRAQNNREILFIIEFFDKPIFKENCLQKKELKPRYS